MFLEWIDTKFHRECNYSRTKRQMGSSPSYCLKIVSRLLACKIAIFKKWNVEVPMYSTIQYFHILICIIYVAAADDDFARKRKTRNCTLWSKSDQEDTFQPLKSR